MKARNPSEPRETFLKKLAYRKASGQGIPGTLSGDFDLSNGREVLERLNKTIAHSERLLATDRDKVMEHRFPVTDNDLAIDSAIQRALGLMQQARSLGRREVIDEISKRSYALGEANLSKWLAESSGALTRRTARCWLAL